MRVGFVHDWLVTYRGGEKVLEALLELYPEAPIHTLFYDPSQLPRSICERRIIFPAWLNAFRRLRKGLLPVFPAVMRSFDFPQYDLLISTSSCVAKAARVRNGKHICYLHSPMRYIWDQQDEYLKGISNIPGASAGIRALTPWLRRWDVATASHVDQFVVNSSFVGQRALEYYGAESVVIAPPVELQRFQPISEADRGDYFVAAGAFVSYKRFDLAMEACQRAGKRLIIMGGGSMLRELRAKANQTTEFIEQPDDPTWTRILQRARALLFPGVEDFGITAIEAMACGTPVIALKKGGALDFIEEGRTGIFFDEPDAASLQTAIKRFESLRFDSKTLYEYAQRFRKENFQHAFQAEVSRLTLRDKLGGNR